MQKQYVEKREHGETVKPTFNTEASSASQTLADMAKNQLYRVTYEEVEKDSKLQKQEGKQKL